jgi:hypothetical protein
MRRSRKPLWAVLVHRGFESLPLRSQCGSSCKGASSLRWLCQLRAAPYSYDLLDNLGRRSPRELTPGLDNLEVGQRVMTIFHLVSFEPDRHLTIVCDGIGRKLLGRVSSTYTVAPNGDGSRLVLKLVAVPPGGRLLGAPYRWVMPWFDLLMMRKQFLTLKRLAEQTASAL